MTGLKATLQRRARPLARRYIGSRNSPRYAWVLWALARARAMPRLLPIYRGVRVEFDRLAHARTVPYEAIGPGRTEVVIRTIASSVSSGTERAHYLVLPGIPPSFPKAPGYSVSGEIARVGKGVKNLRPGQLVSAVSSHASVVVTHSERVFPLPAGVSPEEGAFIQLGVIALDSVWRSGFQPGHRAAVMGRGPIGQLTVQLLHALGASEVISVAPSRRHQSEALSRFAHRIIALNEEPENILEELSADITYEASGDPLAINQAVCATRDGGRVVLLGSSRGLTPDFDFGELADRDISLQGTHISALLDQKTRASHDHRQAAESFLRLIADGALDVRSLIDVQVNPWESGWFYRNLATGHRGWTGALMRWDRLEQSDRLQPANYWTPPNPENLENTRFLMAPMPANPAERVSPTLRVEKHVNGPKHPDRNRKLRVALIGCGARGADAATEIKQTRHMLLTRLVDVDTAGTSALSKTLNVPWTPDYDAALEDDAIDAVYICTPHHLHAEQALKAIAAGKHLIVEKPLATTLEDAAGMVRAAREAGVQMSPWLGFRYQPHVVKAKQLIDAGVLGPVLGAQLTHQLNRTYVSNYRDLGDRIPWRANQQTAGGGVLIMNAIHYLDWLVYLTGMRVKEVSANCATLNSEIKVEDSVVMWLAFENGAIATVNSSYNVPGIHPLGLTECRIWGLDGHVSLAHPFQFYSSRLIDGKRPERWHSMNPLPRMKDCHIEYLDRAAKAILFGQPVEIPGEDGLLLQALIEAAYRSAWENTPVRVEYPEL